ncbi:zinc finger protein 235-like isoform X1 [Clupea harengus]|uniref:Zinc finger protein 235-like isoform X1 n=1 Tax=Clupea harengus TaxID=7950 RepID=A0A6P8FUY1_CLUHA|nr:zinc finger protein 235-like isoform X1 [Clupea harengus]
MEIVLLGQTCAIHSCHLNILHPSNNIPVYENMSEHSFEEMATFISFQSQLVSIMDTLAKTAIFEISKLVDIESRGLKQEISRSQREIASLKNKLQMMESLILNVGEHERNAISEDSVITGERTPEDRNMKICIDGPQSSKDIQRIKGEPTHENIYNPSDGCHQVGKKSTDTHQVFIKEEQVEVQLCYSNSPEMFNSCEDKISLGNDDYARTLSTDKQDSEGTSETPALTTRAQVSQIAEPSPTQPHEQDGETIVETHSTTPEREALLFESNSQINEAPQVLQSPSITRTPWNSDQGAGRGDRRFICTYCSKRFRCFSQLETHQRSHTGEKPFHCTLCGKRYAQKGHLYTHQRTHTGEKPYRCMVCGKGFIQKCTLDMHQRTHTGEKPFLCLRCGKGFTKKCNLKKHQTIHTELSGDFWEAY